MATNYIPKTRAEAKAADASYYFTGVPCKHGHVALRKTKGSCTECLKEEWKQSAGKRADYFREYNRREEVKDAKNAYYLRNYSDVVAKARSTPNELKNQYRKNWKLKNLLAIRADTSARRRRHRRATPLWLTRKQKTEIRQLYQIAITMTKTTGERYVVDHIVPLRSEIVCGLHVPWNLRVITQEENLKKSNRLDVVS